MRAPKPASVHIQVRQQARVIGITLIKQLCLWLFLSANMLSLAPVSGLRYTQKVASESTVNCNSHSISNCFQVAWCSSKLCMGWLLQMLKRRRLAGMCQRLQEHHTVPGPTFGGGPTEVLLR